MDENPLSVNSGPREKIIINMGVIILDEFDKTRYCGNLVLSGKVSHINGVIELLVGIKRPDTEAGTVDIVHVRDKSDTESLFDQGGNAVFIW